MPRYIYGEDRVPAAEDLAANKRIFSGNLRLKLDELGLSQADAARAIALHGDVANPRERINAWANERYLPSPKHLKALAAALHCDPEDLLPTRSVSKSKPARKRHQKETVDISDLGDGTTRVTFDRVLDRDKGKKVVDDLWAAGEHIDSEMVGYGRVRLKGSCSLEHADSLRLLLNLDK